MAARTSPTGRAVARVVPAVAAGMVEAAVGVAQRLVPLPLEYPDAVANVAALIAGDPRNAEHVRTVVTAIVGDAMTDPFRETTANRWRPLLPPWVRPAVIGATVRRLLAAGVLVATGRYVRSTDAHGRNQNKLQPVYALNLTPLREPPRIRSDVEVPAP
ncbi:hypothetical protein [Actinokineospora iranica]|uniref:Uncharacterized protein n=1 Tax=Actinokineospora iranica TaxID=1271860 RepID=A0A1G6K263_9PSEU|nr:hypothetical protein [Actinokineospora iranica]SDC25064.1 hypothetical protein SAMN05216174_101676 [Actinokineospora iranica]